MTRNLAQLAEKTYERRGDYDALWFEGRCYTSGELFERGARLDLGVKPGDRVVVMMENSPDVGAVYHACARAGAVVTPVIFLASYEELRRILVDSTPSLVIASPLVSDTVEAAAEDVRVVLDLDELVAPDRTRVAERADDDLAALVYTGGTTGRAKGVMLTHANLWEAGRHGHDAAHVDGIDRSLSCLPLSHSYGLLVLNVTLHHPGLPQSVLMRWFDAETWLALAQEHRSQIAPVVPSMLSMLLREPLENYDLAELRYLASGAEPLAAEAITEFARRVPGCEIREGYGLTETSALVSTNRPGRIRYGSVGEPVPGTEVRIDGGEILVRSDLVMRGYWNAPELTARTIRDGWLYTGDMGLLDEDGYLTILDRKKDLIIRGGFNVFPRDIEEALVEHPAVATACAVGRADDAHGEEVVAFVTLRGEATSEELLAFGKVRLGRYKYPREIHVVDALPLTSVGKVDRKALRELLAVQRRSEMTTTLTIEELETSGERDLGRSSWHEITQEQVNQFADATGDHQWIHVDPERAKDGPFGGPVAHGYLTLSMLPMLLAEVVSVSDAVMGVNYGTERVRFTSPVPVGSRVRLHAKLARAERRGPSVVWTVGVQVEIEGKEKPALVGEVVYMAAGMPDA